jgi:hypothetical protein
MSPTIVYRSYFDAQPLLVPGVTIAGGQHNVVHVATENDMIFASTRQPVQYCYNRI